MKAACLLTDSMYSLAVSDSDGVGAENGTLGLGFDGTSEVVGGDGTTGAGSTRRGGVSVVSIGTESWSFGVGAGFRTGVEVGSGTGTSSGCGSTNKQIRGRKALEQGKCVAFVNFLAKQMHFCLASRV